MTALQMNLSGNRERHENGFCAEIQDGEIFAFRTNNQSLARGLRYQDDDVRVIDQEQAGWQWMADASRDLSSTGCLAILEFPCIQVLCYGEQSRGWVSTDGEVLCPSCK